MPAAAGIIGLVGAGVGAAQSVNQGENARAGSKINAAQLEFSAQEAGKAGTFEQNRFRRQLNQFLGRQRAVIGANGVQAMGSPAAVTEDTAALGEEEIQNIRHRVALEQYAYRVGAKDALYQGISARNQAAVTAFGQAADAFGGGMSMMGGKGKKAAPSVLNASNTYYGGFNV